MAAKVAISLGLKRMNQLRGVVSTKLFRRFRWFIEAQNLPHLSKLLPRACLLLVRKLHIRPPYLLRMLTDFAQFNEPDLGANLSPIEVLIPCALKDTANLDVAIDSVFRNSGNPISTITLVTPRAAVREMQLRFPMFTVLADEEVLAPLVLESIRSKVPPQRRGWCTQQAIKLSFVLESDADGILIWDSDTKLLQRTAWLNDRNVQTLMYSHELHSPYVRHTEKVWPNEGRARGMSFVTHHQLMQPRFVKEMFPHGEADIIGWIECADWRENSPMSEYHSYGTFIMNRFPYLVKTVVWGNLSRMTRHISTPESGWRGRSVSSHNYL